MMDFLETILSGPVCSDSPAAIITKAGTDAAEIQRTQQAYLESGARLIHTTSPFATPSRLVRPDGTRDANEINWQAAQLARQSAKAHRNAWVAGLVGAPNETPAAGLAADLREQMGALLDGGVQLIHLFGFQRLADLETAVTIKHELHHCPVIATLCVSPTARTLPDGTSLAVAATRLIDLETDVIGVDHASAQALDTIREAASDAPLMIKVAENRPFGEISRLANFGAKIFACPSPVCVAQVAAELRRAE